MSVDSMIRKAKKLAKAGDIKEAATLLRQVLSTHPGHKEALRGLRALSRAGARVGARTAPASGPGRARTQPAPQLLRRVEALFGRPDPAPAIAEAQRLSLLFPTSTQVFNLLGLALTRAGRHEEAVTAFTRLAHLSPRSAPARVNLANVLLASHRFVEAAEAAAEALARDPKLARAAQLRGFALSKAGRPDEAEQAFRTAIRLAPDAPEGHLGLGHLLSAAGRPGDALACYRAALARDPSSAEAANTAGALLMALGQLDEAVAVLGPALDTHPTHRMLHGNIAKALRDLVRPEEAIGHIDTALEQGPETAALLAVKLSCLSMIGDIDAARALLARAMALDPENAELQIVRSQIDPQSFDRAERERLAATVDGTDLPDRLRASLAFALFSARDAAGETEAAAASLALGNALKRQQHPYDIAADARRFEALAKMFDAADPACGPVLSETDIADIPSRHRIVFIVGMPRSGTTLVEQILASHSQVHGAGELRLLSAAMKVIGWDEDRTGGAPTRDNLRSLRRSYLAGLDERGIDATMVTDKMPLNFRYLGHALAAFPEARALVLERDARAVCWSNWSHDFRGRGNGFGNDLGDLARMYRMHLALVERYRAAYPDRIATVPYERLTEHQEEESRKLVAAAGLDWEPACLAFHETRRAVRTASAVQVRRKMYTGSSEAWRRYAPHLAPLLEALAEG